MQAAVEYRLDQFDGFGRTALPPGREISADLGADAVHGAVLIVYRRAERQVGEDFAHRGRQRSADAVNADRHRARGVADLRGAEFDLSG